MIEFAHPAVLGLLVLPVTLAFWEWVRRGRMVVMPVDGSQGGRGIWMMLLLNLAGMLPALLLGLVILILAGPLRESPPLVERQMTNIQIVLDNSASMAYLHGDQPVEGKRTRFDAAMDGIDKFLEMRQGDAFGLTVYARYHLHWVPLTRDTASISMARPFVVPFDYSIRGWQPGFSGGRMGGTYTGSALLGAIDVLKQRPEGDRMIVLVTDGEADCYDLSNSRLNLVIKALKQAQVTCFAIYINDKDAPWNLKRICRETGGELLAVNDASSLEGVFSYIDKMKRVKVKRKEQQAEENLLPFLLAALGVLGLHLLAALGLRYTPW
jgi:Ca-activated chloride channel family protein